MRLPPALSRAAAVGLLVILLVGIEQIFAQQIWERLGDYKDQIAQSSATLARYQQLLDESGDMRARLEQIQADRQSQDSYLNSETETLASADLQQRINAVVRRTRAELVSTQVLPSQEENGFQRIGIRARMNADIEAVQQILYDLESAAPYLFLNHVNIRGRSNSRNNRNNQTARQNTIQIQRQPSTQTQRQQPDLTQSSPGGQRQGEPGLGRGGIPPFLQDQPPGESERPLPPFLQRLREQAQNQENAPPLEGDNVTGSQIQQAQAGRQAQTQTPTQTQEEPLPLSVDFDVYGYMRIEE